MNIAHTYLFQFYNLQISTQLNPVKTLNIILKHAVVFCHFINTFFYFSVDAWLHLIVSRNAVSVGWRDFLILIKMSLVLAQGGVN